MAMTRIQASKAMPSESAPSPLWKLASEEAVPVLTRQFNFHLTASTTSLPIHWCSSELVLLPQPGKNLCHPDQLRPINLLPIQAKLLGSILANRLLEYATEYLADTHTHTYQYAYLPGRSLSQALERVTSHCAQVRSLVEAQSVLGCRRRMSNVIRRLQSIRQGVLARFGAEPCTRRGCPRGLLKCHALWHDGVLLLGPGATPRMRIGSTPLDNLSWLDPQRASQRPCSRRLIGEHDLCRRPSL